MKKKNKNLPKENLKRSYRVVISLNEREFKVFNKYCRKYGIKNKAKFIRETLFKKILDDYDKDYPKLLEI